jgi:flagellum-specific peptidoglycan hydrolase FlgJ
VQPSNVKPSADTYSKAKWLELLGSNTSKNDWNHTSVQAGLNCWIGKLADGAVTTVQTMPWDYKPWGCGSGNKGSCNNGWIQFEICEDGLTDKTYFDKVYKEACEITAYLCDLYNIDPKGTVTVNGVAVPTILCHADSYKLGFGSNHGDVNHWFPKYGKSMTTARNDVAALMKNTGSSAAVKTYKVITPINRYTTAGDAAEQKNAKSDKLSVGTYYIYNKYPDGINGMYNISTDTAGASAGCWINPKENVIKESATTEVKKLYRVRKSKDDAASQKGAFSDLANAKECCQEAGVGYHVFDWDYKIVYSYEAPGAPITLTSITVSKTPTKTVYVIGESYDGSGLTITAAYSDKSTKTVTGYKISGFNSDKVGTQTITVTFEDKTCTFVITVKEKETASEPSKVVAVYDLDYPEKNKIVDKAHVGTNTNCVKAIKKILANNSAFDVEIAKAFFMLAPKYGIDPTMAIAQSILETGWFKYSNSAVTLDQHNYCGLGVTSNGKKGATFNTIEDGVTAQLQHLYAYGCKDVIPAGDKVLDPRFSLVTRGIAIYWQQLAGRWACPGYDTKTYDTPEKAMTAGNTYGQKIRAIYTSIMAIAVSEEDIQKYFPSEVSKQEEPEIKEPEIKDPEEIPDVVPETIPDSAPEAVPEVIPDDIQPEPGNQGEEDQMEEKTVNVVVTICNVLKKLVAMIIELFSKGD